MSRSYWSVEIRESGNTWVATTSLPRPNDNLTLGLTSNQNTIKLADGSKGSIIPETKYLKNNLDFIWYEDTGGTSIKDVIEA